MPNKMPREEEQAKLERLLTEMAALIPNVAPKACDNLGYHPGEASQLNQREQELLGMMLDEKKTEEIAQALGKSENATNAQKSRVTAKLRRTLTASREEGRPK